MRGPSWSAQDTAYLMDNWGTVSQITLASRLQRSVSAIKQKALRLNLGSFLSGGDYITFNQLSLVLGRGTISEYSKISWIQNRDFPVKTRRVQDCTFRVVFLEDFWKWAEAHKTFIDWTKLERNALGIEPDWVNAQRKVRYKKQRVITTAPWTKADDARLISLLHEYRYSYAELSEKLRRTSGAIQKRCCDLGITARPIKADNMIKYTPEEYEQLARLLLAGYDVEMIGREMGRSGKAVRGRLGAVYGTERVDAVAHMMASGGGHWGDGAPPKEERKISRKPRSKAVDAQLSYLCGMLLGKMQALSPKIAGWEDYFQRLTCMHWNDVSGCKAHCENCDTCNNYLRIRPQYCKRCGETFLERETNDFCPACRTARRKAAQKKWVVMDNKRRRAI